MRPHTYASSPLTRNVRSCRGQVGSSASPSLTSKIEVCQFPDEHNTLLRQDLRLAVRTHMPRCVRCVRPWKDQFVTARAGEGACCSVKSRHVGSVSWSNACGRVPRVCGLSPCARRVDRWRYMPDIPYRKRQSRVSLPIKTRVLDARSVARTDAGAQPCLPPRVQSCRKHDARCGEAARYEIADKGVQRRTDERADGERRLRPPQLVMQPPSPKPDSGGVAVRDLALQHFGATLRFVERSR
jgi:hypothetical protein